MLKFLNVDQALADVAHFVEEMKITIPGATNSKIIMAGGSYSATMVAWFRQKYPHLLDGGWASSAPLLAKLDFTGTFLLRYLPDKTIVKMFILFQSTKK